MHIPPKKLEIHWYNTAPDGTCALVALAQACQWQKDQTYRMVPEVSAADATWMRKMLKPLREFVNAGTGASEAGAGAAAIPQVRV